MASESKTQNWSKPAAMAIPKGGFFEDKVEQGRYGPIFPKTPACYGFSIVAKVIPGREEAFYEHARAVSGRVESEGDSRIEGNLIDDLRRLEAARDGSVVFGFTQEGDFGGH